MDADWHALCQAMYMGIEQVGWANLYCKFLATMLWKMLEANRRCEDDNDLAIEQKIINRNVVRQGLWTKHLQNPVLALRIEESCLLDGRKKLLLLSRVSGRS